MKKKSKKDLLPFNAVIQICPECHKIDVYKDDGHSCEDEIIRKQNEEMSEAD